MWSCKPSVHAVQNEIVMNKSFREQWCEETPVLCMGNVIMLLCHEELSIWYGPHHKNRGIVIYNEENSVIMEILNEWQSFLSYDQTSELS